FATGVFVERRVDWTLGPRPSIRRCWRKQRKAMQAMKAKTTDQTTPLSDRCLSHFAALWIPIEAAALDRLLARAEKESCSHLSFLDRDQMFRFAVKHAHQYADGEH